MRVFCLSNHTRTAPTNNNARHPSASSACRTRGPRFHTTTVLFEEWFMPFPVKLQGIHGCCKPSTQYNSAVLPAVRYSIACLWMNGCFTSFFVRLTVFRRTVHYFPWHDWRARCQLETLLQQLAYFIKLSASSRRFGEIARTRKCAQSCSTWTYRISYCRVIIRPWFSPDKTRRKAMRKSTRAYHAEIADHFRGNNVQTLMSDGVASLTSHTCPIKSTSKLQSY